MNLIHYEDNYKFGKSLLFTGIFIFLDDKIYFLLGLFLIIVALFIMWYYYPSKNNILIILEDYIKLPNKEIKEIKNIETIKKNIIKKTNNININNINNIVNYDINYDDISTFLDIFIFVKNIKNIKDIIIINHELYSELMNYYYHYYNIISNISNLNNKNEIIIAIYNLVDDYNSKYKKIYNISKEIFNTYNFENPKYIIKYLSQIFNNMLDEKIDLNLN